MNEMEVSSHSLTIYLIFFYFSPISFGLRTFLDCVVVNGFIVFSNSRKISSFVLDTCTYEVNTAKFGWTKTTPSLSVLFSSYLSVQWTIFGVLQISFGFPSPCPISWVDEFLCITFLLQHWYSRIYFNRILICHDDAVWYLLVTWFVFISKKAICGFVWRPTLEVWFFMV